MIPLRLELNSLAGFNSVNKRIETALGIPNDVFSHYAEPIEYNGKFVMFITDEAMPVLTEEERATLIEGYMDGDYELQT